MFFLSFIFKFANLILFLHLYKFSTTIFLKLKKNAQKTYYIYGVFAAAAYKSGKELWQANPKQWYKHGYGNAVHHNHGDNFFGCLYVP